MNTVDDGTLFTNNDNDKPLIHTTFCHSCLEITDKIITDNIVISPQYLELKLSNSNTFSFCNNNNEKSNNPLYNISKIKYVVFII